MPPVTVPPEGSPAFLPLSSAHLQVLLAIVFPFFTVALFIPAMMVKRHLEFKTYLRRQALVRRAIMTHTAPIHAVAQPTSSVLHSRICQPIPAHDQLTPQLDVSPYLGFLGYSQSELSDKTCHSSTSSLSSPSLPEGPLSSGPAIITQFTPHGSFESPFALRDNECTILSSLVAPAMTYVLSASSASAKSSTLPTLAASELAERVSFDENCADKLGAFRFPSFSDSDLERLNLVKDTELDLPGSLPYANTMISIVPSIPDREDLLDSMSSSLHSLASIGSGYPEDVSSAHMHHKTESVRSLESQPTVASNEKSSPICTAPHEPIVLVRMPSIKSSPPAPSTVVNSNSQSSTLSEESSISLSCISSSTASNLQETHFPPLSFVPIPLSLPDRSIVLELDGLWDEDDEELFGNGQPDTSYFYHRDEENSKAPNNQWGELWDEEDEQRLSLSMHQAVRPSSLTSTRCVIASIIEVEDETSCYAVNSGDSEIVYKSSPITHTRTVLASGESGECDLREELMKHLQRTPFVSETPKCTLLCVESMSQQGDHSMAALCETNCDSAVESTKSSPMSLASVLWPTQSHNALRHVSSKMDLDVDQVYTSRVLNVRCHQSDAPVSITNVSFTSGETGTEGDHDRGDRFDDHRSEHMVWLSSVASEQAMALAVPRPANPSPTFTPSGSSVGGLNAFYGTPSDTSCSANSLPALRPSNPSLQGSPARLDTADNVIEVTESSPEQGSYFYLPPIFSSQSFIHTLFTSGLRLSYFLSGETTN